MFLWMHGDTDWPKYKLSMFSLEFVVRLLQKHTCATHNDWRRKSTKKGIPSKGLRHYHLHGPWFLLPVAFAMCLFFL